MWHWKHGDEKRAHKYAMENADPEEFEEYERIIDAGFDDYPECDLVKIFRKLVAV